jgi:diadenosine tetraphosphate (Ap4A) HIT family hydrolase
VDFYSEDTQKTARKVGQYDQVMGSLTKCPFCDLKSKYVIKRLSGMYLTVNLFPYIDGHLLIVSQRHIENMVDLTKKEWEAVFELVSLVKKLYKKNLKICDFAVLCQQGQNSGRSLGHFHINIVPRASKVIKKEYQEVTLSPLELARMLKR